LCLQSLKDEGFDLNQIAFQKIREYDEKKRNTILDNRNKIISFNETAKILGVNFHLSRRQSFKLLQKFKEDGLVEIVPLKGIRIMRG
jgi:hypothetical protein